MSLNAEIPHLNWLGTSIHSLSNHNLCTESQGDVEPIQAAQDKRLGYAMDGMLADSKQSLLFEAVLQTLMANNFKSDERVWDLP